MTAYQKGCAAPGENAKMEKPARQGCGESKRAGKTDVFIMKKPGSRADAFFTFFTRSANPFFGRAGKALRFPAAPAAAGSSAPAAPKVTGSSQRLLRPEALWTWPLLFLVVAGILFFRQPEAIRHPGFVAEDGTIFFQEGYVLGAWSLLFYSNSGYIQVLPRGVAALASLFPLELVPAVYAVASLAVAAASFTFFYAPGFRPLVRSDLVRIGAILAMCLMPSGDVLMRLNGLPWCGLWFLALVTLVELPRGAWGRGALFAAASLAVWSTPLAIACLPVLGLRAWQAAGDREARLWWTALALSMVAYALTTERGTVQASLVPLSQAALAYLHAMSYRVFAYFFLGDTLAKPLPAGGWGTLLWVALPLALATGLSALWVARKNSRASTAHGGAPWAGAVAFYLILALPALFVLRPQHVPDFLVFSLQSWYWHQRYFFSSILLLCVLGAMVWDAALRTGWGARLDSPLGRACAVVFLLGWARLHLPGFVLWDWHIRPGWKHFAREIEAAEARVNATGTTERVHIPTDGKAWEFDLIIEKKRSKRAAAVR